MPDLQKSRLKRDPFCKVLRKNMRKSRVDCLSLRKGSTTGSNPDTDLWWDRHLAARLEDRLPEPLFQRGHFDEVFRHDSDSRKLG